MKEETVLDVLMYLFHHYMHDSCRIDLIPEELSSDLMDAGFPQQSIDHAIDWLGSLTSDYWTKLDTPRLSSNRVFTPFECDHLNSECRGFLINLLHEGILNPITCEMVIDHLLQLKTEGINAGLVKWVTLMVLFNQPEQEDALKRMELLMLDTVGEVH